jgi:hypothetical protein
VGFSLGIKAIGALMMTATQENYYGAETAACDPCAV